MKRREFVLASLAAGAASSSLAQSAKRAPVHYAPAGTVQAVPETGPGRDPTHIHQSTLVVSGLDVATLTEQYLGMLKQGGVSCWHKSVGGLDSISDIYNFVDSHPEIVVARTVREIRQAHAAGKRSLVFGWQSAEDLGERITNTSLGKPATSLRGYYELGLRIIGIAYNLTNEFGAGNMEGHIPLTRAGKLLVEEVHKLNMLLDVGGHTGEQTSLDAIAISRGRPVICSHTNIAAIARNPRNVSDKVIDAIAGTGGVIGITAVNDFHIRTADQKHIPHSPRVGVSEMVDQIEYVRKRVGVDHVGLGPDFVYGRKIDYDTYNQSLAINIEIISAGQWQYVKGFETIAELPNVTREMIRRGWSTSDIRKVLGENWLRVYQAAWGA